MLLRERGALSVVSVSIAGASSRRYSDLMNWSVENSNLLVEKIRRASAFC